MFETWGPDAVIGTSRHGLSAGQKNNPIKGKSFVPGYWENKVSRAVERAPDAAQIAALFIPGCVSQRNVLPHQPRRNLNRKDNSARGIRQRARPHPSCKCVSPLCPCPCARILTGFPFANASAITASLRNDSPTSNQCSCGTLPHFALQGSRLNICYYHQDLHQRRFHPRLRVHFASTPAPSYSLGSSVNPTARCRPRA